MTIAKIEVSADLNLGYLATMAGQPDVDKRIYRDGWLEVQDIAQSALDAAFLNYTDPPENPPPPEEWQMAIDALSARFDNLVNGAPDALFSSARTISALTGAIVTSTVAGGTQLHATKDGTVRATVGTAITTAVGGTSASEVIAEICSSNSNTAGDWQEVARVTDSQNVTLAVALQVIQTGRRQMTFDVPAGWFYRLRGVGSGTHTETFIGGQKTIYG